MSVGKKAAPMRMCVACRMMIPKKELMRVVRDADGNLFFDPTLKKNGRGAYICNKQECMEKCLKKKLFNHVFFTAISDEIYEKLSEEYESRKNS